MSNTDRLLPIMGRIAHELRGLVGGEDFNGFDYRPATVESAAAIIPRLRALLDEYDRVILDIAREKAKS